ncbi:hypothetical protein M407DRAFT_12014 [Tulasnella calospora MUT 4182]|uniref:F-box domain-containing protein n=1 Tax=Tulasnella calospora MUT 4182 TaxID=1051891 RepID=A0A0C3L9J4_9AGAM|nr:hypothetical protein M407DRAFT_12014 [Tulasnella calospora MUT 4182]
MANLDSPNRRASRRGLSFLKPLKRFWKWFTAFRPPTSQSRLNRRTRHTLPIVSPISSLPMRSPISSLPQELLIMIAELLILRKDQLAFVKTCRAFQDPGLRALYAHVQVRIPESGSDLILATLFHRPDLIRHIRSYSGPLNLTFQKEDPIWRKMEELGSNPVDLESAPEGYFPIIFKHARGIRELKILYIEPKIIGVQTWATICQLPLVNLIAHREIAKIPMSKLLARIRPDIDQLELTGVFPSWGIENLKREDLPKLESLSANVRLAKLLVPGRPIKSVILNFLDGLQPDEELWLKLSQSSTCIEKLDLWPMRFCGELKRTASYLPWLRHLRLRSNEFYLEEVNKKRVVPPEEIFIEFSCHSQVVKAANYFPDLNTLDLTAGLELKSPYLSHSRDLSQWDFCASRIFSNSKSLKEVNVLGYRSFQRRDVLTTPSIEQSSVGTNTGLESDL